LRDVSPLNVRFGSKADLTPSLSHVRFAPESGHSKAVLLEMAQAWVKMAEQAREREAKLVFVPSEPPE
jgi:hypothetical protein